MPDFTQRGLNHEGTDLEQAVSLGTTIVAASYAGGVVMGADTRTSTGSYVANRATNKITALADKVYVCRSGSAADTQNLASYVEYFLQQHEIQLDAEVTVHVAAKLAATMCYQNKAMLQAGLIVAGWDRQEGGVVYGIPLGGTLVKMPFHIGGSGSAYIYGWCDKHWKADMSQEECQAFVTKAVAHAIARDGSSGGCIRTLVINESGAHRHFLPNHKLPVLWQEIPAPSSSREAAPSPVTAGGDDMTE